MLVIILLISVPVEVMAMGNKIALLCEAIKNGDNEEAIKLAEGIRDLNAQSSIVPWLDRFFEGEVTTPLVKACETGNAQMIVWLLEHGAKTDYAPGDILYPLETFCRNGFGAGTPALRQLLDNGADPQQYKNKPPLFRLAQTLRRRNEKSYSTGVEMVLILLDEGAAWKDPTDGLTIIHYAAMQRNSDFLIILLGKNEAASYLNVKNNEGKTPLDIAEQYENEECVRLLKEVGATSGEM